MKATLTSIFVLFAIVFAYAQDSAKGSSLDESGFISLFDGKSLEGWTATQENTNSFFVENGMLVVKGGRAHLFYSGKVGNADFKNFELKLRVRTTNGSNSGVYFHTKYQESGWPKKGFEAQVNSTHKDPKKTGSLYGLINVFVPKAGESPFIAKSNGKPEIHVYQPHAPSIDGEWFDYHITVKGEHITIKVNGKTTVDWQQPKSWTAPDAESRDRMIGSGTFALQAHDPTCVVHYKDIRVKIL